MTAVSIAPAQSDYSLGWLSILHSILIETVMLTFLDASPIHRVNVDGFWLDTTEVTNNEFSAFVDATNCVTVVEMKPTSKSFAVPNSRIMLSFRFELPII